MRGSSHEVFDFTGSTEEELKKSCVQVGEHLYIRLKGKLDFKSGSVEEVREFPIVFPMGGEGVRLLHITGGDLSKHMIEAGGQPLSKYSFDLWRERGFSNFCFLIDDSKRGKSIVRFYGDGKRFNTRNRYSIEHTQLGSGGAVKEAILKGLIENSFIMHYPDDAIVSYEDFPIDFFKVFKAAMQGGYQIVVVCVPGVVYPWGEVCDKKGKVVDFIEKPFVKKDSYTGVCGIGSNVFPLIKNIDTTEGKAKIERILFPSVARNGKMFKILVPSEYWIPVNDAPSLRRFEQAVE